jgi:hypothetical protein
VYIYIAKTEYAKQTIKRREKKNYREKKNLSYLSNILYTKACNDKLEFHHKMVMIDSANNEIQITELTAAAGDVPLF